MTSHGKLWNVIIYSCQNIKYTMSITVGTPYYISAAYDGYYIRVFLLPFSDSYIRNCFALHTLGTLASYAACAGRSISGVTTLIFVNIVLKR